MAMEAATRSNGSRNFTWRSGVAAPTRVREASLKPICFCAQGKSNRCLSDIDQAVWRCSTDKSQRGIARHTFLRTQRKNGRPSDRLLWWSGVAAQTGETCSVLQLETLEVAIVLENLLHQRRLPVVPRAPAILEGMLHLVAEALGVVPRLLRDRENVPHPRPL